MSLKDSLNDHPHMVKLETLTSCGHSLIVQSCYSLDSLLKEMEQLDDGDSWKVSKKTRHLSYARTRSEDLDTLVGPDEVQNLRTILLISNFFSANMNDEEIGDFLGRFQPLRVLSLLHNLVELPTNLMNLTNLYHLDIKGARLQQMTPQMDALGDNLEGMRDLGKLDLRWSNDSYGSLDERVLHQLKPNMNVRCLVIAGYGGSRFPAWLIDQFLVDLEA
ncbi:hypothetical protein NC652_038774 [Populus alba x Populus x berolinensis]|nr:hypothetical protein NC652_038765 [Populus alba x Populus x berolinensis]KAJ6867649.1 hypothetical protein NC652_038766 [Populus alba x Populus x berolinensis]KAJ6867650.1 hypothetical protein NC652_038767 [Populus alba x Populus x berolinensis]KAJ6867651.1 hypothetical protein NC652_038768 [Populus alba x Populus x berolinensis]KAJ6867652.1 hypothetical protein NC652_038769 [Populus alba x Populus x berolinensis]